MAVRRLFLSIWFCFTFFWAGAQSGNPFELIQGNRDSIARSMDDTISLDRINLDTFPSVQNQTNAVEQASEVEEVNTAVENEATIPSNPFELKMGSEKGSEETTGETNQDESIDTIVNNAAIDSPEETVEAETEGENFLDRLIIDKEIPTENRNTFVFWISLLSGLLLSILFTGNRKILNEMMKSLSNINYMKLFQKEERNGGSISFLILYIIYVLNAAIFLRFVLMQFEIPLFQYNLIYLIAVVVGIVVLRHLSLSVVSYLRKRLPDAISYSFIIVIINSLTGLILIPINLMLAFGPNNIAKNIVFLGLFLLALAFILKWFRGFVNSARIILGDSFHFLLYLCTCEIVPIFICIGFLRNLIN